MLAPLAVCGSSSKAFCAWLTSLLAEIVQLSKIQLNWRIWRMAASRSVTLWDGTDWIPWSFWHALSSSLVAVSISVVVTWHRVNWVIDVAKRLTAASFIGVGRAIYKVQLHAGGPAGVGRLHSRTIKGGLVYLFEPEWKGTSIMKSYTTGQGVGLKSGKRRRVPWLDVLWHPPKLTATSVY